MAQLIAQALAHDDCGMYAGDGEGQINSSLTEGVLSLIMKHPNIVKCLGYEATPNRSPEGGGTHEIRLLMEFCDRGSLDKAVANGDFHEEQAGILRVRTQCRLRYFSIAGHVARSTC